MNAALPMNTRRTCTGRNRAGGRCGRSPIPGGLVCNLHGGKTPAVRDAARQRLLEAADPVAAELVRLALHSRDETVRVRACVALLDRSGLGPSATQVNVDGGKVAYAIEGIDLSAL